ncbi:META domain-containing protein [Microbacterium sp. SL62]|uniref:META domain-containing protein n=1 Tax=Microbacterium sp. SL62 TaxID=2995139 RepID=UPI0022756150|nr:META domain-containing protein [Microbacterium sp. SL62]MCY1718012.1 META domain-containing protein [Microbacterium sp. SL62]
MPRRFLTFAAIVALGWATAACAPAANGASATSEKGRWVGDGPEFLTFDDDAVGGSDGCNALSGSYSRTDDTLAITFGLSTLMACPGVDPWLRKAATAALVDDTLEVFDRDGVKIGTLTRAG